MPLRSVKMKRFIFGFQRRVWCPKCTPLSSSWRMVTTAISARPLSSHAGPSGGSPLPRLSRCRPDGAPPWRPTTGCADPKDRGGRRLTRWREEDARSRPTDVGRREESTRLAAPDGNRRPTWPPWTGSARKVPVRQAEAAHLRVPVEQLDPESLLDVVRQRLGPRAQPDERREQPPGVAEERILAGRLPHAEARAGLQDPQVAPGQLVLAGRRQLIAELPQVLKLP